MSGMAIPKQQMFLPGGASIKSVKGEEMMSQKLVIAMSMMLALAVVLVGCGNSGVSDPLDGTQWVLTSVNGGSPLEGVEVTLAFDDGQASGYTGCNSYSAAYAVEGEGGLAFSEIEITERGCLEPEGIMEREAQYINVVRAATGFRLSDEELEISTARGEVLIYGAVGD